MKKFVTTTIVFSTALALSGVVWAQQKSASTKTQPVMGAKSESKITAGRVSHVDPKTKTLTLTEGAQSMTFIWDEHTRITEAGHRVKSSALVPAAQVTVHYTAKGGKSLASAIIITPRTRAAKHK